MLGNQCFVQTNILLFFLNGLFFTSWIKFVHLVLLDLVIIVKSVEHVAQWVLFVSVSLRHDVLCRHSAHFGDSLSATTSCALTADCLFVTMWREKNRNVQHGWFLEQLSNSSLAFKNLSKWTAFYLRCTGSVTLIFLFCVVTERVAKGSVWNWVSKV